LALPGLAAEALEAPLGVAKFDLTLSLAESGEGIEGCFEYATALFDSATVERWVGHWRSLLEGLAEASDATAVGSLPLLSNAERQQVLVEWNATETDYPNDQCIHQLFEAQAEQTPEAVALVFEEQSLTYAELNIRANRLAHHLIDLGVRPDDRVAIGVERSLEMVVGLLAILKAGGAYVPLDPAYPEERLAFMLEDSAPLALLTHGATRERFAALAGDVPLVDLDADAAAWAELTATNPEPAVLGLKTNHLAYVIYTSGSTGKPKGVMVEHCGVSNLVAAQIREFGLGADSRVLQFASVSFDACVSELFTALCSGALLYLPPAKTKLVGEALSSTIARHGLSHATLPPSVLATLPDGERLNTLGTLTVAGERLPEALARRWAADRSLINAYGPTEITVCATLHLCAADASGDPPIGRPIANTRIYVLDSDGQPLPIGVAGELHIGGTGVARGYLNRPQLTAERFLPDPFSAESDARMYRTGDLARWLPDGNLEYIGRADFQVKIRGFRIELGEIEAALRGFDGIREAVVLAREDSPGEKRLVAYVTIAGSGKVAGGIAVADGVDVADNVDFAALPATLKTHLQSSLPSHMVPAAFVVLESLPLTPNGKLDRKALPAPEADAYATGAYAPPKGPVEEALAELWSELLGIEQVGRHDDFFALGGHSLLAIRLLSELDQAFGVRLPVGAVFLRPTLSELAEAVGDSRLAEEAAALVPLRPEGVDPPLFLLPGAIGSVLYLQPLAEALGEGRPVLALPTGWPANPGIVDGIGRPPSADLAPLAAQGPLLVGRPFLRRPGGV
jgi:amino acid adenylation domain-containing protein